MDTPGVIFKTKPNYFFLLLVLAGGLFFSYWAWILLSLSTTVRGGSEFWGQIIIWILAAVFAALAIGCIVMVISARVFYIDSYTLIIKQPLLFFQSESALKDIMSVTESGEPIYLKGSKIYSGRKAIIEMRNGRNVMITSFEIHGYRDLIKKLKRN